MRKKPPKTPREKKRESYAKDRRNTYGEDSKASRKGVPRKKRRQNREERRLVNKAYARNVEFDPEVADAAEAELVRKHKEVGRLKHPDKPLGQVLAKKLSQRIRSQRSQT
jgi:hypothetical protein